MYTVLSVGYVAIMILVFLGMSIFVHELGHFLSAKWCGMVIDTFSIGLGPAIWKRKFGEVTYKIGWIPFGGYVALPQLDPAGMSRVQGKSDQQAEAEAAGDAEPERSFPPIAPWKRIIVSASGATGNIILAVIIAWLVYWIGIPTAPSQQSAALAHVVEESSAYEQGLRGGDVIDSVNGKPMTSWIDVLQEAALCNEITIVAHAPDGTPKTVAIPTVRSEQGHQTITSLHGLSECLVGTVGEGTSAEKAGIISGDVITEVDGIDIINWEQLVDLVSERPDKRISVKVRRDDEEVEMFVTPKLDKKEARAVIGVRVGSQTSHPLPSAQLKSHATLIFRVLKALVTPSQAGNAARAVGGPVAIFEVYYKLIISSMMLAVWFTGVLNVNLAIINLLPMPILDGGHIMFCLWEMIARKPASPKVVDSLVNVFGVLLACILVLLLYRDIKRIVPQDSAPGRVFSKIDRLIDRDKDNAEELPEAVDPTPPQPSTND
jgi:regulator of sigma E protease